MTLLFIDSCQDPVLVPKPEWFGANSPTAVTTGRSGETNGAINQAGGQTLRLLVQPSAATCVVGMGYRVSAISTATYFGFMSDATTVQLALNINTSGFIEARRTNGTGTLLGTSSGHTPIAVATWAGVQVKCVLHTSTGSVSVRLNDVLVLDLTGITTSSVIGNVTGIQWTSGALNVYIDDIWVCDGVDATATQSRANNDFLGDLRVQALLPTAAGDTTQWTASTGANYTTVDETPPNTTDYVSSSTSGQRDLYQVADLTGTVLTVYGVRVALYVGKTDPGTATVKPVVKENSVVTVDTAQAMTQAMGPVCGTLLAVRPSDSGSWTSTDVNALQIGQEVA